MKLVCSQTELNTALQLVSRAVASRPTHPVLANVLLTADLTPKVADMGSAMVLEDGMQDFVAGSGSPLYQAPEVLRREEVDERCDVWSYGYEKQSVSGLCDTKVGCRQYLPVHQVTMSSQSLHCQLKDWTFASSKSFGCDLRDVLKHTNFWL